MLAAVYHGPDDLRVEEVPRPVIGDEEVLLKVLNASICGTDLRILHGGHRKYPNGTIRIPGHEMVGEIAAIGARVSGFEPRQRVFVAPNMGCRHCHLCATGNNNICPNSDALGITLDGGFAEYVRIPAAAVKQGNLAPLGDDVDSAAAALIEPMACVLRGQDAVNVGNGDVVLIVGAGPIGVMHTLLARLRGAASIIVSDSHVERREYARQLGADRVVDWRNEDLEAIVRAETGDAGTDVVIVAAPSSTAQEEAVRLAAMRGRINFFGGLPASSATIQLDANLVHYKELMVTGTTACSTSDCQRATALVNSGRLNLAPLISQRFPLRQASEAFAAAANRSMLKIALEP